MQKILWTTEQDDILIKMWAEGYPTKEIAYAVGRDKNGVIGRARRINLPKHQSTSRRALMNTPRAKTLKYIRPPIFPDPIPVVLPSSGVAFLEIGSGQCRAVIGKDDDEYHLSRFCGHPVREGESYCPGHCYEYFNPPRGR